MAEVCPLVPQVLQITSNDKSNKISYLQQLVEHFLGGCCREPKLSCAVYIRLLQVQHCVTILFYIPVLRVLLVIGHARSATNMPLFPEALHELPGIPDEDLRVQVVQ
jgi:hypothetical protein